MKKAFTMIELVFVIVVLGILAAVAFPKLGGVVEDASYAQALSTISSIRSAISTQRQSNLIRGSASYPELLDDATKDGVHEALFDGNDTISILQYPIYSKSSMGGWMKTTDNSADTIGYKYYINDTSSVAFTYNKITGLFDCDHTNNDCVSLTE